jgi:hypothetical protein
MTEERCCGSCANWLPVRSVVPHVPSSQEQWGECHRYAPQPLAIVGTTARIAPVVWPGTRVQDICGEWYYGGWRMELYPVSGEAETIVQKTITPAPAEAKTEAAPLMESGTGKTESTPSMEVSGAPSPGEVKSAPEKAAAPPSPTAEKTVPLPAEKIPEPAPRKSEAPPTVVTPPAPSTPVKEEAKVPRGTGESGGKKPGQEPPSPASRVQEQVTPLTTPKSKG